MSARRSTFRAVPQGDPYIRPLVVALAVIIVGYFIVGLALAQYAAEHGVVL